MTPGTAYPETRKKLAKIHQQRAMVEMLAAPGWAIMADEQRQQIVQTITQQPTQESLPSPPKVMEASASSIGFAHED